MHFSHGSPSTTVFNCGLVINPDFPWLGASPDRLAYDPNARPLTGGLEGSEIYWICTKDNTNGNIENEANNKKNAKKSFCLKIKDGHLQLDENHNYFYQVQGQEGVSGIEWFDFALLTDPCLGLKGLFLQRIFLRKKQVGVWVATRSLQSFISTTSYLLLLFSEVIIFVLNTFHYL